VPLSEARTIATVTLFCVGFWILCVLARPLNLARGILLASMLVLFVLALSIPFGRQFFALDVSLGAHMLLGFTIGVAGAAAIEFVYRRAKKSALIFDRE
jgi:cation-transporting ATPase E